jgi:hypothetical protein
MSDGENLLKDFIYSPFSAIRHSVERTIAWHRLWASFLEALVDRAINDVILFHVSFSFLKTLKALV